MVRRATVGLAVWMTAASAIPGVGKAQEAAQAAGPRTGSIQIGGRVIDGPPPPVAPETITRDASGGATVRAVRLDGPWQLDGVLNEPVYSDVQGFGDFIQQAPDEGAPASERTEAWILYDDEAIYVAARLWESVPESEWVANEMQRDSFQLINNDGFIVVFDTFYDRRNGFAFRVNPIGGFQDYQITDEGDQNLDWNPVWDVRTGRFDGGWTVEMVVPFKSLRFRPGPQVWGIQLGRDIRSNVEEAYLTAVPISAGPRTVPLVGGRHAHRSRGAEGQPDVRSQALRDRVVGDRSPCGAGGRERW